MTNLSVNLEVSKKWHCFSQDILLRDTGNESHGTV